jgi:hypothetical protein
MVWSLIDAVLQHNINLNTQLIRDEALGRLVIVQEK